MLVKVLMLLLLVSTSRCFSNYILTHSSKHVELYLLNIDHTPFLLVPRNFRTFSLVEDMRRSQVSTRTLDCMHSLIRTQIFRPTNEECKPTTRCNYNKDTIQVQRPEQTDKNTNWIKQDYSSSYWHAKIPDWVGINLQGNHVPLLL